MRVADIMTENPITILPDRTIQAAMDRMGEIHCHHLPVMSRQGHLIGIISENDCLKAISRPAFWKGQWSEVEVASTLTVDKIMTPAPIVVEPDAPADDAARLMLSNNIRGLPVMRVETLVGIVTASDLLIAFMQLVKKLETA